MPFPLGIEEEGDEDTHNDDQALCDPTSPIRCAQILPRAVDPLSNVSRFYCATTMVTAGEAREPDVYRTYVPTWSGFLYL